MSANFKPKRTAAASHDFLAIAWLSCYLSQLFHCYIIVFLFLLIHLKAMKKSLSPKQQKSTQYNSRKT